jgi:trans-aconitate 2-methyltransferase
VTGKAPEKDWNPEAYARFRGLRLRPALDLLAQVGALPAGDVIDLGCGDGAAAEALAARFERAPIGVDRSPAMLAKAKGYARLIEADISTWTPEAAPALIFSNAALHWLPEHASLLPRLASLLAKGGILAVQMPRQFNAPSHRFLRDIAAAMFPDRFDFTGYTPPVQRAEDYAALLMPLGEVNAWETDYVQRLEAEVGMHPVRAFTASTAMRPLLELLNPEETEAFCTRYDAALAAAYPHQADGAVLFPFRRVFFTLKV